MYTLHISPLCRCLANIIAAICQYKFVNLHTSNESHMYTMKNIKNMWGTESNDYTIRAALKSEVSNYPEVTLL